MIAMLLAFGLAATGPSPIISAATRCPDDPASHFARKGGRVEKRKLTDLPPASPYAAVLRRGADGCIVPVAYPDTRHVQRSQRDDRFP